MRTKSTLRPPSALAADTMPLPQSRPASRLAGAARRPLARPRRGLLWDPLFLARLRAPLTRHHY